MAEFIFKISYSNWRTLRLQAVAYSLKVEICSLLLREVNSLVAVTCTPGRQMVWTSTNSHQSYILVGRHLCSKLRLPPPLEISHFRGSRSHYSHVIQGTLSLSSNDISIVSVIFAQLSGVHNTQCTTSVALDCSRHWHTACRRCGLIICWNKKAVLSQRWPHDAPYIWVPWKFLNVHRKFEMHSLSRSWDNSDWNFGWGLWTLV